MAQAEDAARKAVELGESSAITSTNLAYVLLESVRQKPLDQSTSEFRSKLDEVEQHLRFVERTVPQARLNFHFGLLAWNRRETRAAIQFLKQGAIEMPRIPMATVTYLSVWVGSEEAKRPFTETTGPCVTQFPDHPQILAFHAGALYADERYLEAYETLQKVRSLDESAVRILGEKLTVAIDERRWITPLVEEGMRQQQQQHHGNAVETFWKALKENPDNFVAARLLARSLLRDIHHSSDVQGAVSDCNSLCQRFPNDAELHIAHAVALSRAGQPMESNEALKRGKELGGDVDKLVGAANVQKIRKDARQEEVNRNIRGSLFVGLVGLAGWVAVMFAVGALLAIAVSRQPDPLTTTEEKLSPREIWLERAYLLILTIGLIVFYLSLPFVSLGLLAITLVLFLLMLGLRIVHLGILYRGMFAVWGVIRSATIGPPREVLGIEVLKEQYPRLFEAFTEVADRLQTRTVDLVYLTPTSLISVHDRGYGPFGLFRKRRVMEIGIPTFASLTVSELKSILAHEFAHFSHQHTFYSRFIFQVSASLSYSLAVMNAAGGAFNYVNPFYGFYWLYLKGFALIAAGFSRSHEFLADRRAAFAYGKDTFRSGFTKISVEGHLMQETVVNAVKHGLGLGRVYINVFDSCREYHDQSDGQDIRQRLLENLLNEKPGWYDSHPTYSERLAAVDSLTDLPHPIDLTPSANLVGDIVTLETQLTEVLTRHIYNVCDIMQMPDHLRAPED